MSVFRQTPRWKPQSRGCAARQHGVIALPQLRELGLSASAVRRRVAVGRLHRIDRGVFSAGHALLGWRVVRSTYRQVIYSADDVAATVAALLA